MKEIKSTYIHYFKDSSGDLQGEYKEWYSGGQLHIHSHYKDDELHGEYKWQYSDGQLHIHCHFKDDELYGEYRVWDSGGQLCEHTFDINGVEIINFLEEPDEYPSNSEEDRLLFKLKYGTAPFLDEL